MALFGRVAQPVGLDIGSDVIRVAQIKPASDPILIKFGHKKTDGCLADGETTDVDALASSISDLWKQTNISERRVILGISNQKVIVRLLTMPYMEKDDLSSAIQFQAQDNIPIPIEEAIIDYQVINEFTNADNQKMVQVMLVAAQKEMIQKHIAALEKAKLKPYIVDVSAFALSRSLLGKEAVVPDEKELEKSTKAIGFLDIGESVTNISIVQNRNSLFCRVVPIGDSTFVKAISDILAVSLDEAYKLKSDIGFPKHGEELTSGLKKAQLESGEKVRSVLGEEAVKFVNEIRRSFEYGLSEAVKSEDLSELIVSGAGASGNLLSYLKDLYSKVGLGDSLSSVTVASGMQLAEQSAYAIAIGLALRGIDD